MECKDSSGYLQQGGGQNGAPFVIPVTPAGVPIDQSAQNSALLAAVKMPTYTAVTNLVLTTSASAGVYQAFPAQACEAIDVTNDTGVAIEYVRNGAGNPYPIPNGAARLITGITNASQISFRVKGTASAVTVSGEALKV